jgi:uncharacterized alkaline shock family protein YloU
MPDQTHDKNQSQDATGGVALRDRDNGERRQPTEPQSAALVRRQPNGMPQHSASLVSDRGTTRIADVVVAKIAGFATREIPGVQQMGKSFARSMGGLRSRVPGATDSDVASQGVSVEIGEKQCAVDLDLVTYYGQSILEIAEAVRSNVIARIEGMTGLEVKEVNIAVDDLYVEGLDADSASSSERDLK